MSVSPRELDVYNGEIDSSFDLLKLAANEFKRDPFTPEAVTLFQQAFWQVPRGEEGLTFDIPPCTATKEQLRKPFIDIKGRELPPFIIYIPEELRGKDGLIKLGKMFPELGSYSVKERTAILDEFDQVGYVQVEGVVKTPNVGTDEYQLREHYRSQGARGQRLITYIIASRQMEVVLGQYPDQGHTSRLLRSRNDGRVVGATCYPNGDMYVFARLNPQVCDPTWGGRSERVL